MRTADEVARPGRRTSTSKGFVYDFASISQVHQAGHRQQDSRKYEPMAWPEYLQWYTQKCPNHQRYLSANEYSDEFEMFVLDSKLVRFCKSCSNCNCWTYDLMWKFSF